MVFNRVPALGHELFRHHPGDRQRRRRGIEGRHHSNRRCDLVNAQELDSDFKMKVYDLINQWFEYAFHPAMAIANLLDPKYAIIYLFCKIFIFYNIKFMF